MKTLEEFRQFHDTQLLPHLRRLESKRKLTTRNVALAALIFLIPLFIIVAIATKQGGPAIFILVAGVILFLVIGSILSAAYVRDFKLAVISKIVKFVDENLEYDPDSFVSKSLFENSKIWTTKPDNYSGDDRVFGKVGDTRIEFSEIEAEEETGSGKDKTTHTIFHGLFFVADFNKDFSGRTVLLPDHAEKALGSLGKMMQAWNLTRDDLVKLEDPEFEQLFVVYGTDQIEARYILSTSLMARIVDFRKKTDRDIYISFLNSSVVVAIPYDRQLFEPKLFTTLLDYNVMCEYFNDVRLAVGIVEDLNLNTRIWSKQIEA